MIRIDVRQQGGRVVAEARSSRPKVEVSATGRSVLETLTDLAEGLQAAVGAPIQPGNQGDLECRRCQISGGVCLEHRLEGLLSGHRAMQVDLRRQVNGLEQLRAGIVALRGQR